MGNVDFLNLEYFLVRTYDFLSGFHLSQQAGALPERFSSLLTIVGIFGLAMSFLFLILIVYVSIRLLQVEHEGFHEIEKKEHEGHQATVQHAENTGHGSRFEHIVTLANSPEHGDWRRAIIEADIMLSDVLNEQGYVGETVADQLRQANPFQMTTLDLAWQAHKVRNQIAHQGEKFDLTERDVRATVDLFRRVFEEFGAI